MATAPATVPGSLSEGAAERSEAEEVYPDERNAHKFQSQKWLTDNHRPGATIGRHSLSQPFGLPAPSEREPGWGAYHSTGYSLTSGVAGDFHRPYETQRILVFTIQRTTLPGSLPEGAGEGVLIRSSGICCLIGCCRGRCPLPGRWRGRIFGCRRGR